MNDDLILLGISFACCYFGCLTSDILQLHPKPDNQFQRRGDPHLYPSLLPFLTCYYRLWSPSLAFIVWEPLLIVWYSSHCSPMLTGIKIALFHPSCKLLVIISIFPLRVSLSSLIGIVSGDSPIFKSSGLRLMTLVKFWCVYPSGLRISSHLKIVWCWFHTGSVILWFWGNCV